MGQGSRGGNGGLSASGRRQREDKAIKGPRRHIERQTNPGRSGERRPGEGGSSSGSSSRRGGVRLPYWLGAPNLGLPNLSGIGGSSGKKKPAKKAAAKKKTVKPPAAKKTQSIKKIARVKPIKVKLTKQRTNKTPN
jgi:hypothetical protein